MINYDDSNITDSAIAAEAAALAFRSGRLDLGWEFARIALRARDIEVRGPLPAPLRLVQNTPVLDEVEQSQPIPRLYGSDPFGLAAAGGAAAAAPAPEIQPEPELLVSEPTQEHARCGAQSIIDGVTGECRMGIVLWRNVWSDSQIGHEWRHVDASVDDHEPIGPAPSAQVAG